MKHRTLKVGLFEISMFNREGMVFEIYLAFFPILLFFIGILGKELWVQRIATEGEE